MWRAFFGAVGAALLILGFECLVVEKAVLASSPKDPGAATGVMEQSGIANSPNHREVRPPEWAPWTFLSVGAVIILYTFTIKRGGD